jgi:FK506-binding protein 2
MRFSSVSATVALFLVGVSALDKPLDIQVVASSKCERKTKVGQYT